MVTSLADSGPGSLRQAVLDANGAAGADEVAFAPGLTGTVTLTSGEILITDSLLVHSPGAGVLTVSGNDMSRIFHVEKSAVAAPIDVTLSGLTLTHGRTFPAPSVPSGGAVLANGENLTISGSVISDSMAEFAQDPPTFVCGGNVALLGLGGVSGETLRIVNSLLTGGTVSGIGSPSGGNLCVVDAKLVLERSTLTGGSAWNGGGLFAASLAAGSSIFLSTIVGNEASVLGGGIATDSFDAPGELEIRSSTISGNTGGAGGGISTSGHSVQILESTISGNDSDDTGGGIFSQNGSLEIVNSTVSTNQARLGGGIYFAGSAPGSGDHLLLRLTTVTNNTASVRGGSLLADTAAADVVQLDHSILANGTPEDLAGGATPATVTAHYTLIEAPGTAAVVGTNNLIGADPLLGPLADNGGPTRTHELLPGSPAIDAGNPAIPSPPATDQRGFARIFGPAVDLGSVEAGLGIVAVPTLSQMGTLVLCALLFAAGLWRLR